MPNPKYQSGDPMWQVICKSGADWSIATDTAYVRDGAVMTKQWIDGNGRLRSTGVHASEMRADISKTDINFEAQSQKVYDLVHDQLRPAMKKMTGRYYQKMLDDMTAIEKLVD